MTLARTYKVVTLGCKLNQFDSASIEGLLRQRGFTGAENASEAGVVVINTCTVTARADREALRLARRARRARPDRRVILTGCYAERDRARLEALGCADAVVGRTDRARLPALFDEIRAQTLPVAPSPLASPAVGRPPIEALKSGGSRATSGGIADGPPSESSREDPRDIACIEAAGELGVLHFGERTRAFLKIQEGCDLRCTYCVIPAVRGRSRSIPPPRVAHALEALIAAGYREIVLTGVNSGDYGRDLAEPTTLAALLEDLLEAPGLGRLRLNSLEPRTVTPRIIELIRDHPRMARHLQVPLQSGCDATLGRMRRNYSARDYLRILETLREAAPDAGLGADVIAGFPGETDEDFESTVRFIERSPLDYLHVFSYSSRPGTLAAGMEGAVPASRIAARAARLRELGRQMDLRFRREFLGRTLDALVFYEVRPDGRFRGLTGNFIDLSIDARPRERNTFRPVRIERVTDTGTYASVATG